MKRREFIGIAAAAGLVAPAAAIDGDSIETLLARPRLLRIVGGADEVADLGARYLAAVPGEADVSLLRPPKHGVVEPGTSPTALRPRLVAEVQREFAAGDTVTLDGWVLARTEARQCALFSLQPA